jgi:hypothetical protein
MMDNINVKPGEGDTVVLVKTDVIDSVHVPIYKTGYGADGELTLVDPDNPMPIEFDADASRNVIDDHAVQRSILKQLKLLNLRIEEAFNTSIREEDIP